MGALVLGFAVGREAKGFRWTGDEWFRLVDMNWRITPQDTHCQITLRLKIHPQDLRFQLHFLARSRPCTHSHMCSLAQGPEDARAFVWVVCLEPTAPQMEN